MSLSEPEQAIVGTLCCLEEAVSDSLQLVVTFSSVGMKETVSEFIGHAHLELMDYLMSFA